MLICRIFLTVDFNVFFFELRESRFPSRRISFLFLIFNTVLILNSEQVDRIDARTVPRSHQTKTSSLLSERNFRFPFEIAKFSVDTACRNVIIYIRIYVITRNVL